MDVERLLTQADFGPDFVPTRLDTPIRDIVYNRYEEVKPETMEERLQKDFDDITLDNTFKSSSESSMQGSREAYLEQPASQNEHKTQAANAVSSSVSNDVHVDQSSSVESTVKSVSSSDLLTPSLDKVPASSFVPASLEVEQLGEQVAGQIPEITELRAVGSNLKHAHPFEGFRDDLYGVSRTDLINKALMRKHKTKTRPVVSDSMLGNVAAAVSTSALKATLTKKQKGNRRESSVSDFERVSVMELRNTRTTEEVEEVFSDDEFVNDTQDKDIDDDEYSR